jgi:hypothetical protein
MAIFAILPQPNPNNAKLPAAIKARFGDNCFALDGGAWLIAAKLTAVEVSEALAITDGSGGGAVIVEVASYYGRANPSIWNWIKNHWDAGGR